jgi:hypothetical protein
MTDDFFDDLSNTKPYLKIAFEGFAGCGKTYTMAQLAAGLHKRINSQKPIVIFDTEEAAKFLKKFFDEQGIKVLHRRSRSLADLKTTMQKCKEGVSDILMIDSITHVWENYLQAYMREKRRQRLQFEDWGVIKPTWKREFSDPFVRDPYHTLMTGRAGYEYEDERDEEGRRQIYKSGIKMKVEGETAYEPDILVLMSRHEEVLEKEKKVWRSAMIIKDRSTLIDGKEFNNPTFEHFEPAIAYILDDARTTEAPKEGDTAALFEKEENIKLLHKQRDILLEKIEAELTSAFPGMSAEAKKMKTDILFEAFGTRSWTEVKGMHPERLQGCLDDMMSRVARIKEMMQ